MENISRIKEKCVGCKSCEQSCPKHCISIGENKEGFWYPIVDEKNCVECGKCLKTCPAENIEQHRNMPQTVWAWRNKNDADIMKSASGGAADSAAKAVLQMGGVVYGAACDEQLVVSHIEIESNAEREKIQSSKYVQSDPKYSYSKVKQRLAEGKKVLYTGTPCQIAGLYAFLGGDKPNLYTVDLICHGVPSQQMLYEHINHILNGRSAERLSFRKGQSFHIELTDQYGTVYSSEPHRDMYYRAFWGGISYRESCYECPFARRERVSDITIGDFWGLQDAASLPLEISEGISVLLPSSEKGKSLIAAAKSDMWIYERSVEEAVEGNTQLYRPVHNGLSARLLSMLYPCFPFDKAVRIVIVKDLILESLKNILRSFKPVLMPIINVIRR
mgnify:CR=1 FL=1